MPLYDYECRKCEKQFDAILPMADNKLPEKTPCEDCGGEIFQVFLKMNVGDSVRLGITKPNGDFKEVMEKIHTNTVGSTLDEKMSQSIERKTSI